MVRPVSFAAALPSILLGLVPRIAVAETAPAPAQNPQESRPRAGAFSVAALLGGNYGDGLGVGGSRLMLGYGVRAGYSFETTPLYLGVTVVTFQDEIEYDDTTETGTERHIDLDIDVGAELEAGPVLLRPYLGLGVLLALYDGPSGGNSAIGPRLSPGLLVRYPLGGVDVGVEARLEHHLLSNRPSTVSALGSVGVAF